MRSFLMVVAAAAFLAAGATAVRGQGEFPLKYVLAEENDPLAGTGMSYFGGTSQKPPQIKALPQGLSGNVMYFEIPVGGKRLLAVLDASSPPKLYVDVAGTRDLSAVTPLVGKVSGSQCCYGPVDVAIGDGKNAVTAKVVFVSIGNNGILGVRAAGYLAGAAKLDGQTYRVAVLNRYESAISEAGTHRISWRPDAIAIDFNQDGKFAPGRTSEIMPLSKAVCVKDKYYRVEVAPDGSSITFEKYVPKMGTLDIGMGASLALMSDTGVHNLSGSNGKWQVPEGNYTCRNLSVAKTDAAGKEWLLSGNDVGPLRKFEVRGGETTTIEIGPPLTLKVDAFGPQEVRIAVGVEGGGSVSAPQPSEPQGGPITLSVALAGKGGETYSLAIRKGVRGEAQPPPPKVKIFDASGKLLAQGDLEFG